MILLPVALAFAEDAPAQSSGGPFGSLMSIAPLVILFVIFYFLLIRPQQKKAKEHKQMLSEVQKGVNVVTNSGIYGRVISVQDETLTVEIAENVKVKVAKEAIAIRKPQS